MQNPRWPSLLLYSRPRFKDTKIKDTPRRKDTTIFRNRVSTDNLCVEKRPQLTAAELRGAITTWLNVEDDPAVLEEEIDMEIQAVENNFANLEVDSASSEEEDGDGRPESCIASSLTEADVRSRFEEVRPYLYANGKDGEYRETLYLLLRSVHSFTHEIRAKRKAREGGETQAILRDLWRNS